MCFRRHATVIARDIQLRPLVVRAGGARGDLLSGKTGTASISFQETKSGGTFAWHDAPVRQLVITLSGTLDFQTRKGEHFIIRPGDILLAEDPVVRR